jgi:hypothetical protein
MKGTTIELTSNPKGVFLEGIVSGTPLPGHNMQVKAATEPVSGRHTWQLAAPGSDGLPVIIAILLPDHLQGKLYSDAYVDGTRCFMYCPIAGEEMNVRCGEGGGTHNTFAIADLLMSDADSGIFVPNSAGTSVPWQVMETLTQVVDDTLVFCQYTGH